jgi:hypothetical protein
MCVPSRGGVLISQPVHQHAYETAVAAQRSGHLRWFATGLYDSARGLADPRLRSWLPPGPGTAWSASCGAATIPPWTQPASSASRATT